MSFIKKIFISLLLFQFSFGLPYLEVQGDFVSHLSPKSFALAKPNPAQAFAESLQLSARVGVLGQLFLISPEEIENRRQGAEEQGLDPDIVVGKVLASGTNKKTGWFRAVIEIKDRSGESHYWEYAKKGSSTYIGGLSPNLVDPTIRTLLGQPIKTLEKKPTRRTAYPKPILKRTTPWIEVTGGDLDYEFKQGPKAASAINQDLGPASDSRANVRHRTIEGVRVAFHRKTLLNGILIWRFKREHLALVAGHYEFELKDSLTPLDLLKEFPFTNNYLYLEFKSKSKRLATLRKEQLGDPKKSEVLQKTLLIDGIQIEAFLRLRKGHRVWAIKREDLESIRSLFRAPEEDISKRSTKTEKEKKKDGGGDAPISQWHRLLQIGAFFGAFAFGMTPETALAGNTPYQVVEKINSPWLLFYFIAFQIVWVVAQIVYRKYKAKQNRSGLKRDEKFGAPYKDIKKSLLNLLRPHFELPLYRDVLHVTVQRPKSNKDDFVFTFYFGNGVKEEVVVEKGSQNDLDLLFKQVDEAFKEITFIQKRTGRRKFLISVSSAIIGATAFKYFLGPHPIGPQRFYGIYCFHNSEQDFINAKPVFDQIFETIANNNQKAVYVSELGGISFELIKERYPLISDIKKEDVFTLNPDPQKLRRFREAYIALLEQSAREFPDLESIRANRFPGNPYQRAIYQYLAEKDREGLVAHISNEALVIGAEKVVDASLAMDRHQLYANEAKIKAVNGRSVAEVLEQIKESAKSLSQSLALRDEALSTGLQRLREEYPGTSIVYERGVSHLYGGILTRLLGDDAEEFEADSMHGIWTEYLPYSSRVLENESFVHSAEMEHLLLRAVLQSIFKKTLKNAQLPEERQAVLGQSFYEGLKNLDRTAIEEFFRELNPMLIRAQQENKEHYTVLLEWLDRRGIRVGSPAAGWKWMPLNYLFYPLNTIEEWVHWFVARKVVGVPADEPVVNLKEAYTEVPILRRSSARLDIAKIALAAPLFWSLISVASGVGGFFSLWSGLFFVPAFTMVILHIVAMKKEGSDLYRFMFYLQVRLGKDLGYKSPSTSELRPVVEWQEKAKQLLEIEAFLKNIFHCSNSKLFNLYQNLKLIHPDFDGDRKNKPRAFYKLVLGVGIESDLKKLVLATEASFISEDFREELEFLKKVISQEKQNRWHQYMLSDLSEFNLDSGELAEIGFSSELIQKKVSLKVLVRAEHLDFENIKGKSLRDIDVLFVGVVNQSKNTFPPSYLFFSIRNVDISYFTNMVKYFFDPGPPKPGTRRYERIALDKMAQLALEQAI